MSNLVNYVYWKWDEVLSPEFCRSALQQINWDTSNLATVGSGDRSGTVNTEIRRTDIVWQDAAQPLGCIIKCYVEMANQSANWNYILSGQENTQIGRYRSDNNGCYDWHEDSSPPQDGIQRKLSCVILLNDPSEFEGGVLQFEGLEDQNLLNKQGSIIVFPSFIRHRVIPITKGYRYTAVSWVNGPSFR
jgi:PKHD-type hydroxylase